MPVAAPRVSVIMSVRNGADYLAEALDSLLAQTLRDIEIVLIDNGSTDATPQIIAGYRDPRIRLLHNQVSLTLTDALNQGLAAASAEVIARLDADDIALPDRLERQLAYLDANPDLTALGTGWEEFGAGGVLSAMDTSPLAPEGAKNRFAWDQPLVHSSLMARQDALRAVGGYPTAYVYAQDFALYLALLEAGFQIGILGELLVRIRAHAGQASLSPAWALPRTEETLRLFLRAGRLDGLSAVAKRANRRKCAQCRLSYAWALWRTGRQLAGIGQGMRALSGDFYTTMGGVGRHLAFLLSDLR